VIDDRRRGWALAAFGMLMVSTDSLFIRSADFDAWTIAFVFGLSSTVALVVVAAITTPEPLRVAARRTPLPLAAVALTASVSQIAFTGAVTHTAVSNVVVIVASTPIFAAVLARIVLRERTDRRVVVAIVGVLGGIAVVVSGSLGEPTLDGDLLALLAIVLFSLSVVVWRRHPELNRPLALAASSATMALVTAPLASVGSAPARVFVATLAMGLVFNPIGRLSYSSAPKYAPAAEVALFTPVETVAATAWAWIFFSERPSIPTVVGGAVVITAVLYGTVGGRVGSGRRHEGDAVAEQ
jgi:drug/metabolite transporter (DMT)-like permease